MGRLAKTVIATGILMPTLGFGAAETSTDVNSTPKPDYRYSSKLAERYPDALPVTQIFEAASRAAASDKDTRLSWTKLEGGRSAFQRRIDKWLGVSALFAAAAGVEYVLTGPEEGERFIAPEEREPSSLIAPISWTLCSGLYYACEDVLGRQAQLDATARVGKDSEFTEPSAVEYVAALFNRQLPTDHSKLSADIAAFQIVHAWHTARSEEKEVPKEIEEYFQWAWFQSLATLTQYWKDKDSKAEPIIFKRMRNFVRNAMVESTADESFLGTFGANLSELIWGRPAQPELEALAISKLEESMDVVARIIEKHMDEQGGNGENAENASSADGSGDGTTSPQGADDFEEIPRSDDLSGNEETARPLVNPGPSGPFSQAWRAANNVLGDTLGGIFSAAANRDADKDETGDNLEVKRTGSEEPENLERKKNQ